MTPESAGPSGGEAEQDSGHLRFTVEPYGEFAYLASLGAGIDEGANELVMALAAEIQTLHSSGKAPPGLRELVPAYESLLVALDPDAAEPEAWNLAIREAAARVAATDRQSATPPAHRGRLVELPVAYGGDFGPDLTTTAAERGLNPEELIALHAGAEYRVYMLGFMPGFPYLGGMDGRIATPRLATPRAKVPAGSVGIADEQTGIYPFESPGGWKLIGRCPLPLFDARRGPPALIVPGDRLRFTPVDGARFTELARAAEPPSAAVPPLSPAEADFVVLRPGPLCLVVDHGRHGYRALGVPESGPADPLAYALANAALGNEGGAPAFECAMGGLAIRFKRALVFALGGASAPAELSGRTIPFGRPVRASPGDELSVGMPGAGLRVYFAVRGGIKVPAVLGSASSYLKGGFGGLDGRPIKAGDGFQAGEAYAEEAPAIAAGQAGRLAPAFAPALPDGEVAIRCLELPEARALGPELMHAFYSSSYTVGAQSDRMGLRLEGPALEAGGGIVSSPTLPGTIQLPADGRPIALMADGQTTGGYARLAQVIRADLWLLGQARPGTRLRFVPGSIHEARRAYAELRERVRAAASAADGLDSPPATAGIRRFRLVVDGQAFEVSVSEQGC